MVGNKISEMYFYCWDITLTGKIHSASGPLGCAVNSKAIYKAPGGWERGRVWPRPDLYCTDSGCKCNNIADTFVLHFYRTDGSGTTAPMLYILIYVE